LVLEIDKMEFPGIHWETGPPGVEELKYLGVKAKRIERPAREQEARDILSRAFKEKWSILPCGGGTSMGSGMLPESVDVALDMTGMNRVLAFDPRNLNLAVLSGMTLGRINEYLAGQGRGFFLPLDPPLSHRATVGGVYASNASGPSRLRYGTVRDQVLGVRGVDGRGREVGFGGKTVKNVSGYDLTKFFIGSAGSLCLITSLSFRVYPLPESSSLCDFVFETLEGLEKFLAAFRSSVLIPSAVIASELAAGPDVSISVGPRFRVWASFEGHSRAVDRQNRDILKLAEEFGARGEAKVGREEMVQSLRSVVNPDGPIQDSIFKVSVPISQGPRAYVSIGKLVRAKGLHSKVILFPGNGLIYIYFQKRGQEGIAPFIQDLKDIGQAGGGYGTPVRAHRNILASWGPRVEPGLNQLFLKPIKEQLDPAGIFPPIV
jgi:glycolate oxidase FAD binding subunit